MSWKQFANCRGEHEIFFSDSPQDIKTAINICSNCTVQQECLEEDRLHPDEFIRAGKSMRQRRKMYREDAGSV